LQQDVACGEGRFGVGGCNGGACCDHWYSSWVNDCS
jgi:hypothetical protein